MKNIISILVLVFCASSVFAQSDKTGVPAIQMIPAQTLKVSPTQATPVAASAKPVVVEAKQSNGGTLVQMPTVTLASDNGTQAAIVAPQTKLPEQVNGQPKAAVVVETAPSLVNPTPKSPKQN